MTPLCQDSCRLDQRVPAVHGILVTWVQVGLIESVISDPNSRVHPSAGQ